MVANNMPILDSLCRSYQRLFPCHAEANYYREVHASSTPEEIMAVCVAYGRQKGTKFVEKFSAITDAWHGTRVLDFGCAWGGLSLRIRECCPDVVGIDIDKYTVACAEKMVQEQSLRGLTFIAYEGGSIPCPDSSFDTVFCVDVVEHLPDVPRFIAEFRRILKPGGLLLLSFGPPWCHAHGKHMWATLPGWWTHLLFPTRTVMRVSGFPEETTWEDLGIFRLTVGTFHKAIKESGFEIVHLRHECKRPLRPLVRLPWLRELLISEVIGVFRNPE